MTTPPVPPRKPRAGTLTDRKLTAIRRRVRKAPKPRDVRIPEWLEGLEEMADFFESMAAVWDQFSRDRLRLTSASPFYQAVAAQLARTEQPICILDVGCGTGLELAQVLARAPRAAITGIDLSARMLGRLARKFRAYRSQLTLIEGSYLDVPLGAGLYDYALSTLTLHHLPPHTKLELYRKTRGSLKPGGIYIEGDHSASARHEREALRWYRQYVSKLPGGERGEWNYNMPLSVRTQTALLRKAGFTAVKLAWEERDAEGNGNAVFVARRRAHGERNKEQGTRNKAGRDEDRARRSMLDARGSWLVAPGSTAYCSTGSFPRSPDPSVPTKADRF